MKNRILFLIMLSICALLFSCTSSQEQKTYILPSITEDKVINNDYITENGCFINDSFYFIEWRTNRIQVLNLFTEEVSLFTDGLSSPMLIAADEDGVCVYDKSDKMIHEFSFDGQETAVYSASAEIGDSRLITDFDTKCGTIILTNGASLWALEKKSDSLREIQLTGFVYKEIISLSCNEMNRFMFVDRGDPMSDNRTLYCCSLDGTVLDQWDNSVYLSYFMEDNVLYHTADGETPSRPLYRSGKTGDILLCDLNQHTDCPPDSPGSEIASLILSGNTIAVWWYETPLKIILYPLAEEPAEQQKTLRLLYSEDELYISYIQSILDESVSPVELDNDSFQDKLITKLLAGDDDFDLVYVRGGMDKVSALFHSLAENGLYVDLNTSPDVRKNLSDLLPGVRELVSKDGEIVCLPVDFIIYLYGYNGPEDFRPDYRWNTEDLCRLCDDLFQHSPGYSVFSSEYIKRASRIPLDMICGMLLDESNEPLDPDSDTQEEIRAFLEQIEPYIQNGTLFGDRPVCAEAVSGSYSFRTMTNLTGESQTLIAPPTVGDNHYSLGMSSFLFINPKSANKEEALALLAKLTSPINRYNLDLIRAPLYPHFERYYVSTKPVKEIKEKPDSEKYKYLESIMQQYYVEATLGYLNITSRAWDAMADFCAGKATPEETARVLYEEIVYAMKG